MSIKFKSLDFLGFPGYRVGEDGSVWSRLSRNGKGPRFGTTWRLLKSRSMAFGHLVTGLRDRNRKPEKMLIHRLVLLAFVGPCPDGMECCHNDGNPKNNHLVNLRWDSHDANMKDGAEHGVMRRGEAHHRSIMTATKVVKLRKLRREGLSFRRLGELFGIDDETARGIVKRTGWRHVK